MANYPKALVCYADLHPLIPLTSKHLSIFVLNYLSLYGTYFLVVFLCLAYALGHLNTFACLNNYIGDYNNYVFL